MTCLIEVSLQSWSSCSVLTVCFDEIALKMTEKFVINSPNTCLSHSPTDLTLRGTQSISTGRFFTSKKHFRAIFPVVVVPPAPTLSGVSTQFFLLSILLPASWPHQLEQLVVDSPSML